MRVRVPMTLTRKTHMPVANAFPLPDFFIKYAMKRSNVGAKAIASPNRGTLITAFIRKFKTQSRANTLRVRKIMGCFLRESICRCRTGVEGASPAQWHLQKNAFLWDYVLRHINGIPPLPSHVDGIPCQRTPSLGSPLGHGHSQSGVDRSNGLRIRRHSETLWVIARRKQTTEANGALCTIGSTVLAASADKF